ncbi:MAG: tetratricopeptide repeat protein [Acidimicrobiales bacterium]
MARKGVRRIREDELPGAAQRAWRDAVKGAPNDRPDDVWIDEGVVEETTAKTAKAAKTASPRRDGEAHSDEPSRRPRSRKLPPEVAREFDANTAANRSAKLQDRLAEAARAYDRDRYRDALRMLRALAEEAPGAASVRELLGLTYYRLGRWRQAIKELEEFRTQTGSYDQHPTLADCYRALGQYGQVEELWEDLRVASPGAPLVAEGRLVAGGALADQGKIQDAIAVLEQGKLSAKRPQTHHLRLWYALADLYERAGEVPRALALFERVANHDPDLYDVVSRIRALA